MSDLLTAFFEAIGIPWWYWAVLIGIGLLVVAHVIAMPLVALARVVLIVIGGATGLRKAEQ